MISLEELEEWKKKRDAVILAHYYVRPEVQALADYIGDSYFLSKKATELANKTMWRDIYGRECKIVKSG